ncbi:MAG: signal peptidase II [Thiotrichales bacterium]|nr:signal peptidase II [Thiotrichales bacterium]
MRWLWVSVLIVAADQLTKFLAMEMLVLHQPVAVMPLLNMTLTFNPGAAFSFLGDAGGWQRWLFIGLAVVISIVILVWLMRVPAKAKWLPVGLALVLGGAVGNLWDRITIGRVVDFIDVYYSVWHWPAFNVADSAICVGAIILVITSIREPVS